MAAGITTCSEINDVTAKIRIIVVSCSVANKPTIVYSIVFLAAENVSYKPIDYFAVKTVTTVDESLIVTR